MDILLELIMEIVMDGTIYTAQNKKVSLWIRIPLILILLLFFGFIIIGCFLAGITIMQKEGFLKGLIMVVIAFLLLFAVMIQIYDYQKKHHGYR